MPKRLRFGLRTGQTWHGLGYARHGVRAVLSVAAVVLLGAPIAIALLLHERSLEVGSQPGLGSVLSSPHDLARWRAVGASLPRRAAPVVLAYHDIRSPKSTSDGGAPCQPCRPYNVTPERLDQELTMLQTAGYRSVSAGQYIAYLKGGVVPSRSLLLSFDGGAQGLWTFADQILARHHMRGVAFIHPTTIETHWTRRLSWSEIRRMQASGRWEFEAAVSQATLASQAGSVATRVAAALRASNAAFHRHSLPVAELLTWPVRDSPVTPPGVSPVQPFVCRTHSDCREFRRVPDWAASPPRAGRVDAAQVVRPPFAAALAKGDELAPPTSRRAAAGKLMGRIEVVGRTKPDDLLNKVVSLTAIPVSGVAVLAQPLRWGTRSDASAPVEVSARTLRFTSRGHYESVTYAAASSADWNNYVLDTTLRGLKQSRTDYASLLIRVGSAHSQAVRINAGHATLIEAHGSRRAILGRARLFPSAAHHVRIVVRPTYTRVTIDHLVSFAAPVAGGTASAGGIGLAALRRSSPSWPTFAEVSVIPATAAALRPDRLPPLSLYVRSPLVASALWVRSPFAPATVTATPHTLQFSGVKLREFAEYAPTLTSGWIGYAFGATVENLSPGESVALYGRVGSRSQAVAIVNDHWIKVFSGAGSLRKLFASHTLARQTTHRLSLHVLAGVTTVQADGISVASLTAGRGTTGGVGVGVKRTQAQAWPRLVAVTVAPLR